VDLTVEVVDTDGCGELANPTSGAHNRQPAQDALNTRILFELLMKSAPVANAEIEALADKLMELARPTTTG
jgi:hypothetical protein